MCENYKVFPPEETQWNLAFLDASKNKNKKKILALLRQANKVYLDEYYIDHFITELNNAKLSQEKMEEMIKGLTKCKIVEDVAIQKDAISIKTASISIMVSKLSNLIPEIDDITPSNIKENILLKSSFRSEYISQMLSFPNSIVVGYTYGISSKAKSIHTWVEFKNNKNQEFVIFPDSNTVYNKEGFYFLKHAEPIKKISSDSLKGKNSIGKSSGFYIEFGTPVVDIEIDMDDMDMDIDIDASDDER